VPFFQKLPANTRGRDFIVGDLHGCFGRLQEMLLAVDFDYDVDRLILVGDLVDRGPDSWACLNLLTQPWFYSVVGNHEAMLLTYLGLRGSDFHLPRDFLYNGGGWILGLSASELAYLTDTLAPLLMGMPVVIRVDHFVAPYNVVHSELMGRTRDHVLKDHELGEDLAKKFYTHFTWGRRMAPSALSDVREASPVIEGVHIASNYEEPGLSLTYVGHNILPLPVMYRSHVYLDRGAYEEFPTSELFFIEHGRFASALQTEGFLPRPVTSRREGE
jgi:serine/threonine protein phosphatase 1